MRTPGKRLLIVGAALVIGAGLYYGYVWWQLRHIPWAQLYFGVVNDPCASHLVGGRGSEDRGNYQEAIAIYREGIGACSEKDAGSNLRLHLGQALLKTGQHEEAKQVFEDLMTREPENAQAHLGLSFYYAGQHDQEKATAEMKRFLALAAPDDPERKHAEGVLLRVDGQRVAPEGRPLPPGADDAREVRRGEDGGVP